MQRDFIIRFELEPKDTQGYLRYSLFRGHRRILLWILLLVPLLISILSLLGQDWTGFTPWRTLLIEGLIPSVSFIVFYLLFSWFMSRNSARWKGFQRERIFRINEEGIVIRTKNSVGNYKWEELTSITVTEKWIVFYIMKMRGLPIPLSKVEDQIKGDLLTFLKEKKDLASGK